MPQISYFLGVIIRIFYRDHNPPHFHASYADFEGIIDIQKNEIIGIIGTGVEITDQKETERLRLENERL
jgi:hypothetical protein